MYIFVFTTVNCGDVWMTHQVNERFCILVSNFERRNNEIFLLQMTRLVKSSKTHSGQYALV